MANQVKTILLLGVLSALLIGFGAILGKAEKQATDLQQTFAGEIQKQGIDFTILRKTGKVGNMMKGEKLKTLLWLQEYEEAGGDKALKKTVKNVSKLSFLDKVYASLGGDKRLEEMQARGLNPFMRGDILEKIQELKYFKRYEELGGTPVYARLGGLQAVELSMHERIARFEELVELSKVV